MKLCGVAAALVLVSMAGASSAGALSGENDAVQDRTITKVVNMLQEMLDKSKSDGENDRTLYAKFKCWCDQTIQEKEESVKKLKKLILILEAKIAELMAENGKLSIECYDISKMIEAAKAAIKQAKEIRQKERDAFIAEEADLKGGITQCKEAIKVLAEVGADQTMASSQEHKQFMAGMDLVALKSRVQTALSAAAELLPRQEKGKVASFLQAPFTGTYSSQSGEVVGILKNMLDTLKANLMAAVSAEEKAVATHEKFLTSKTGALHALEVSYEAKQAKLGENDEEIASTRIQLEEAQGKLADDEEFLAKTLLLCKKKAEEYERRKQMRANEEAAIAQAIAILNSDSAFETFGKSKAGSDGLSKKKRVKRRRKVKGASFLQLRSTSGEEQQLRDTAQELLAAAARQSQSLRLSKIVVLLETGNPFTKVLEAIDKFLKVIDEEGELDKKNLKWCDSEREENHGVLEGHEKAITALEQEIDDLKFLINDPETGLLAQIQESEATLKENHQSQVDKTADRAAINRDYQTNIRNIVDAQDVLDTAMKVLKNYYDSMAKAEEKAFFQQYQEPPETWSSDEATEGGFEGQSEQGEEVMKLLEFIREESEKEEMTAHKEEETAQHEFEDEMADLKKEEGDLMKALAELKATLATKYSELEVKEKDHKKEVAGKVATENYLEKIKPGCDFITDHIEARDASREAEGKALKKARGLLKSSPAYKAALHKAKVESWGACKGKCAGDEEGAECKACLAGVTVPGYCASHPDTTGC